MNRRSFLKMIFAAIMTPFLPKGNQEEETAFTADEYFLPRQYLGDGEKRKSISDFLMSLDCYDQIEVSLCEPCETHDLSEQPDYVLGVDPGQGDDYTAWMRYPPRDWVIDPVDDLIDALEEIRTGRCEYLDPSEGYFDIRTSPVRRSRGRPFPTIASLPHEEPDCTFTEALEEIRRVCCDPDLWKMPIERTVIMSPGDYKWCVARLEGVTYTPVDNDELTDASDV